MQVDERERHLCLAKERFDPIPMKTPLILKNWASSEIMDPRFIVFIPSLLAILFAPKARIVHKISDVITLLQILWVINYAIRSSSLISSVACRKINTKLILLNAQGQVPGSDKGKVGGAQGEPSLQLNYSKAVIIFVSVLILYWSRRRAFLLNQEGIVFSDSSVILFAFWSAVKLFIRHESFDDFDSQLSESTIIQRNYPRLPYYRSSVIDSRPTVCTRSENHPKIVQLRSSFSNSSLSLSRVHRIGKRPKQFSNLALHNTGVKTNSDTKTKKLLPFQTLFKESPTTCVASLSPLTSCTTLSAHDVFQQPISHQAKNNNDSLFLAINVRLQLRQMEKRRLSQNHYLFPIPVNEPSNTYASAGSESFKSRKPKKLICQDNEFALKKTNKLSYIEPQNLVIVLVFRTLARLVLLPVICFFWTSKFIIKGITATFAIVIKISWAPLRFIKLLVTPCDKSNTSTMP